MRQDIVTVHKRSELNADTVVGYPWGNCAIFFRFLRQTSSFLVFDGCIGATSWLFSTEKFTEEKGLSSTTYNWYKMCFFYAPTLMPECVCSIYTMYVKISSLFSHSFPHIVFLFVYHNNILFNGLSDLVSAVYSIHTLSTGIFCFSPYNVFQKKNRLQNSE